MLLLFIRSYISPALAVALLKTSYFICNIFVTGSYLELPSITWFKQLQFSEVFKNLTNKLFS